MATYSYSKLETFKNCPRKFYYRYVAKLPLAEEPEFIAPFLGSRVHDALEQIYARVSQGIVPSEIETLDFYRRRWTAEWTDDVVIPEGAGSPEDFCRLGEQWIGSYDRRFAPFNDAMIIRLEMPASLALDGDGQRHDLVTHRGFLQSRTQFFL
jgi:PD-(D/E)XK nuclease superfamily